MYPTANAITKHQCSIQKSLFTTVRAVCKGMWMGVKTIWSVLVQLPLMSNSHRDALVCCVVTCHAPAPPIKDMYLRHEEKQTSKFCYYSNKVSLTNNYFLQFALISREKIFLCPRNPWKLLGKKWDSEMKIHIT